MTWFYRPLSVLIEQPWLALLPGLVLLALYGATRRRLVLVAAFSWLAYCLYEEGMRLRILCSGECNIRIDLLLIYPVLVGFTLLAAGLGLLALRKHSA